MSVLAGFIQQHVKRLLAIAVIVGLFWFTRLPALSANEQAAIADRFDFSSLPLPELKGQSPRFVRSVHPSLERH